MHLDLPLFHPTAGFRTCTYSQGTWTLRVSCECNPDFPIRLRYYQLLEALLRGAAAFEAHGGALQRRGGFFPIKKAAQGSGKGSLRGH